ncbi:ABC transporter permease [Armatimonas rosea]|uniref:ABC-type transport system involved in multi-copper enzyme maturation permease subunit n=1 Tax=Armatimonas rosea TaxID=685828 RepID=A0A7W9SVU5_ARMRO|nr:ABC transporter permease subunit [Armatimonas rosea]MBB6053802.1 ABC-type transport system involved in multi-copper enzyme maturation permease subunit [Armatimonas rosea]
MTINWENPILTKELRTRMRGAKAFWILLLYLGLLSLILGGTYLSWIATQERQGAAATQSYDMGRMFYGVLFVVQAALVGLITPALTSGALSIEREQRTFEALSVSPLPRRSIVLGKLTSAVGFVGLLLLSSVPLVALCFLLGGVSPQEVTAAYVLLLASAFLYGATGIAFSSFAKNTTTSTVLTYGTILVFFFSTLPAALTSLDLSTATVHSRSHLFLLGVNPVGAMVAGNLTESYFGLNVPSWLMGIMVNGLLGTILTVVALHRIEYPRTDRSGLLRGLTTSFIGLIVLLACGHAATLEGAAVGIILLPLLLIPLFVSGEGLGTTPLRKQLLRLKEGNPVSGLLFVTALMVLSAVLLSVGVEFARHSSEYWTPVTNFVRHAVPAVAISLSALFGFGSLTLLLSQKLKNRWGVMALSFAILAAVYFLPLSTESFRNYDEPASAWVNSYCLSPLISTFYLENSQGRIIKALFYDHSTMWLLNCAFTSLIGVVSLSLLKRARRA